MKEHMNYVKNLFSKQIQSVKHERLLSNTKTEMENILDFCALPFEENCLYPERNNRKVITASSDQATQKIYKTSSSQKNSFRPFLPPCLL